MKRLHLPDLYAWSAFDAARNVDFNGVCIVRPDGNVLVDPMPLSDHDRAHLEALGGARWIVVTNSDHVRATHQIADWTGASVAGPAAERDSFPLACDRWLGDGESVAPGIIVLALDGSKTPGELAVLIDQTTLVTGDLVRAHHGGSLMMLPDAKLVDRRQAVASVRRLAELPDVDAVLVGDGWPVFRHGHVVLAELAATL